MTEVLEFVRAGRKIRDVTVTLTAAVPQVIVRVPKGTRLITAVFNTKTAFAGGVTSCDIGILGSLESILADMSIAAQASAIPTSEWQDWGYETTATTDIYVTAGAGNTVGEVDVTLFLSLSTDIRM